MTILKYYDETDGTWKPFVNNANDAVTLSGDQTIAGEKTFTEDVNVAGDIYINGEHIFLAVHPVGSIHMSVSDVNPGTVYGGTWVAWGSGRVPVGVDTGQTEFNTVEKTGGHKLMQSHKHTTAWRPFMPSGTGSFVLNDRGGDAILVSDNAAHGVNGENLGNTSSMINNTGGGNAENLQPYITCYMWKRTA